MFKFDYVPPEQLNNRVQLSIGRASFVVTAWTDKDKDGLKMFSQAGDPKVNLILMVRDSTGQEGTYYDSLTAKTNWKLKRLLDSLGLGSLYTASGSINLDALVLKSGACELKAPTGDYKKLNIDYLTPEQSAMAPNANKPEAQHFLPGELNKTNGVIQQESYMPPSAPKPGQPSQSQMDEYDDQIPF